MVKQRSLKINDDVADLHYSIKKQAQELHKYNVIEKLDKVNSLRIVLWKYKKKKGTEQKIPYKRSIKTQKKFPWFRRFIFHSLLNISISSNFIKL